MHWEKISYLAPFLNRYRLLMEQLVPVAVRCHDILILVRTRIYLSDACSVEFSSRWGDDAGASGRPQQGNSRDRQREKVFPSALFHLIPKPI
jgi:hypothetical protein